MSWNVTMLNSGLGRLMRLTWWHFIRCDIWWHFMTYGDFLWQNHVVYQDMSLPVMTNHEMIPSGSERSIINRSSDLVIKVLPTYKGLTGYNVASWHGLRACLQGIWFSQESKCGLIIFGTSYILSGMLENLFIPQMFIWSGSFTRRISEVPLIKMEGILTL